MLTPEELSIHRDLEQEQRTMPRQTLLKKLWKLRRMTATDENNATRADEPDRPMLHTRRRLPARQSERATRSLANVSC